MKIAVVLNGAAGTLAGRPSAEAAREVETLFAASGHRVAVTSASGPDCPAGIDAAVASDADVVVVGGGDGTVATAANRIAGTGKALGVLPLGTLNLFAKDLGVPLDLEEAVPRLARGTIRPLDVGEVNGRLFLNHSVLGLYPRMVEDRESQRRRLGRRKWPAMALAALQALREYPLLEVTIEARHRTRRIVTPALVVSNNLHRDGFGRFLHRERLDAGELGLYVARHRSPIRLLRLMIGLVLGDWQHDTELEVVRLTNCTVTARRRRLRVANDGEVEAMAPPLHYRIRPGGLPVLVPAPAEAMRGQEREATG